MYDRGVIDGGAGRHGVPPVIRAARRNLMLRLTIVALFASSVGAVGLGGGSTIHGAS